MIKAERRRPREPAGSPQGRWANQAAASGRLIHQAGTNQLVITCMRPANSTNSTSWGQARQRSSWAGCDARAPARRQGQSTASSRMPMVGNNRPSWLSRNSSEPSGLKPPEAVVRPLWNKNDTQPQRLFHSHSGLTSRAQASTVPREVQRSHRRRLSGRTRVHTNRAGSTTRAWYFERVISARIAARASIEPGPRGSTCGSRAIHHSSSARPRRRGLSGSSSTPPQSNTSGQRLPSSNSHSRAVVPNQRAVAWPSNPRARV